MKRAIWFLLLLPCLLFSQELSKSEMDEYLVLINTPHPLINGCGAVTDEAGRSCAQKYFKTCWKKFHYSPSKNTIIDFQKASKLHDCIKNDSPINISATQRDEYARFIELKGRHLEARSK